MRPGSNACLATAFAGHGNKLKKLNRPADQRKALIRGLTTELIRHGRIKTTTIRCKELRKTADHMVTLAKGLPCCSNTPAPPRSSQGTAKASSPDKR